MSALRAEAIQMINQFPEEKVPMVINYMKSIRMEIKSERTQDSSESMEAFYYLKNLKMDVPDDFDEKKELMEALDEKYDFVDMLMKNKGQQE